MTPGAQQQEVLVADDSAATTAMLRMLLERAGYRVRVANNGRAAIDEIARSVPDLVLCDIEMPELDGYQVLELIRQTPGTERLPVILVTSKSDVEDKIRGLDIGATDYVTKPFKIEELKARIRSHLRVKALQDEVLRKNLELDKARSLLEEKIEALATAYQKIAEHQTRTRRALDLAFKVQRGLIPSSPPSIDGYRLSTAFRPAEEVAGDFYDFIDLGQGLCGIVIGDVAGKGVGASLVMVLTRTLLRGVALSGKDPAVVLERVNQLIIKDYGSQDSTTLFYGILDPATGSFKFADGGHEFPILVTRDRQNVVELGVGGPFLGIFPKARYNQGEIFLATGDQLTFFTDGIYHLESGGGKVETNEHLIELLRAPGHGDLDEFMRGLGYEARGSSHSTRQIEDDITVIQLTCDRAPARTNLGSLALYASTVNNRELVSFVEALARSTGLEPGAAADLVRAVEAVGTNAFRHAYATENGGFVHVTVHCADHTVRVVVSDQGRGFSPARPVGARSADQAGGAAPRGLELAAGLVDDLQIVSAPGKGTTVTLSKKLG
ncbi:MAG: SpoIIE family protein phosphatase [Candidatus Riflebacteria bacterium]|nr:SpoIIE family protein phosphatase [Candidatus Riflebacteria bacterium]